MNGIPNSHVEEIGSIISKHFLEAFNDIQAGQYRHNLLMIMSRYCGSCYLQNQYLEQQRSYVEPQKIEISGITIQYFSIKDLLKSIVVKHPYVLDSIVREQSLNFSPEWEREEDFTIMNELDITDQERFERLKGKLRIEISLDDFTFVGKKGRKFLAGYLTCSNLEFRDRTKRDQISMFLMVKRPAQHLNEEMFTILSPFVQEMKRLGRDGIDFFHKG